ncbi:MAG: sugar phosphate isomerase/epimerase family protein [Desulfobacteraceae bacterium]|jgi:sugar phosphate isomerase/epimerase
MRFGAMNFPVAPVLEEIEALAGLGMDFVELAMDPPEAHFRQLRQQKQAIRNALDRSKLALVCHLPTFVYTAHLTESIRQASLDEVMASLETASELGAEKAVVHPGYIDGLATYVLDYALGLAMDSLEKIRDRARQLGMVLCIENMFPRVGPFVEPEDFEAIFQSFPEMKLVLDTGHANIDDRSGRRVIDFIMRFGDRLEHLHVSDNSGYLDEHLPLGYGNIEFKAVARALGQTGYDKTITLEIFGEDRTALVKSRRKLEKLL